MIGRWAAGGGARVGGGGARGATGWGGGGRGVLKVMDTQSIRTKGNKHVHHFDLDGGRGRFFFFFFFCCLLCFRHHLLVVFDFSFGFSRRVSSVAVLFVFFCGSDDLTNKKNDDKKKETMKTKNGS